MTDEQRRIRSYLEAQAAKLTPTQVIDKVRAAMGEVRAAVLTVPAARFNERPAADDWSANEVMAHIVKAGAHFSEGIVKILDGASAGPAVADRIEAGAPVHSAAAWWERLSRDRE